MVTFKTGLEGRQPLEYVIASARLAPVVWQETHLMEAENRT